MHKTGTTALQRFFRINADHLSCSGYLYPSAGRGIHRGQHLLAHGIEDTPSLLAEWEDVYREADRSLCQNLILSPEDFEFRRDDRFQQKGQMTGQKCGWFETKIVVYLRRQDQFAQSAYLKNPRISGLTGSVLDFIAINRTKFDYYRFLEPWRECFGRQNILVRVYEEARSSGGLFADFVNSVGLSRDTDWRIPEGRINSSVPPGSGGTLQLLNQLPITDRIRRRLIGRLLRSDDSERPGLWCHRLISTSDRTAILQQFEISNQRVALEYLGRSDGKLFKSGP